MKKKIISIVGLALFVGAVAFNAQMHSKGNLKMNRTTLYSILTASAEGGEMFDCTDYCTGTAGTCPVGLVDSNGDSLIVTCYNMKPKTQ